MVIGKCSVPRGYTLTRLLGVIFLIFLAGKCSFFVFHSSLPLKYRIINVSREISCCQVFFNKKNRNEMISVRLEKYLRSKKTT